MDECSFNFCHNIRFARREYGMTQKQMAEVLGVSVQRLRKIEAFDPSVRLSANMVSRFCDYFIVASDAVLRERFE